MLQVRDSALPSRDPSSHDVTLCDLLDGVGLNVLFFYVSAFSLICDGEFWSVSEHVPTSASARARTAAISCDRPPVQRRWVAKEGHDIPETHRQWPPALVACSYGVVHDTPRAVRRADFVLECDRVIGWTTSSETAQARNVGEEQRAIQHLLAAAT